MTPYEMEEQINNLDARTTAIEHFLPTLATKDDLRLSTEALRDDLRLTTMRARTGRYVAAVIDKFEDVLED